MSESVIALAFLGTFAISILAVNVGVWLAPRVLPGAWPMRVGSILVDLGMLWTTLSMIFLQPSYYYEYGYIDGPRPIISQEASVAIGLTILGSGLAGFAYGFGQSRRGRPEPVPQMGQPMPGPPPR